MFQDDQINYIEQENIFIKDNNDYYMLKQFIEKKSISNLKNFEIMNLNSYKTDNPNLKTIFTLKLTRIIDLRIIEYKSKYISFFNKNAKKIINIIHIIF